MKTFGIYWAVGHQYAIQWVEIHKVTLLRLLSMAYNQPKVFITLPLTAHWLDKSFLDNCNLCNNSLELSRQLLYILENFNT